MKVFAYNKSRYAALAIVALVFSLYLIYLMSSREILEARATTESLENPVEKPERVLIDGGLALAYATAYQNGDCDEIIRLTAWMSDRLRRVAIETSDPATLQRAREALCAKILSRPYEDNVLRSEGIDDKFVFPTGSTVEVESKDKGRTDLGSPVDERFWLRVTYPRRETAPLAFTDDNDSEMKPVRAWTVGVNVGREDKVVLKASVRGNLEIKTDSASFDWPDH